MVVGPAVCAVLIPSAIVDSDLTWARRILSPDHPGVSHFQAPLQLPMGRLHCLNGLLGRVGPGAADVSTCVRGRLGG